MDKTPHFGQLPFKSKIQYPFIRSLHRQQTRAFQGFAAIVSLSEFLQETIKVTFGADSTLIRTSIDPSAVRASDYEPHYITMVNPRSELKGSDIFIRTARQLPKYEFLIAGEFPSPETRDAAVSLDNVIHLGWVDDMRRVYQQTKLLLVPSLVEEGGPRVICEAFTNGIPVVGTNRGGIPGFIGPAGGVVTDPYDIAMWERRIDEVFETYDRKAAAATERIALFDAENNVGQFEALLQTVTEEQPQASSK
jgi:glycosyltransferase involved in cell wall biosynthesis